MFGGAEAPQPLKRVKGLFPPGQNEANHHAAQEDTTKNGDLHANEFPDTMICGKCRSVFTDFVAFRDHRRSPCSVPRVKE
uniref:Uncharacterized protein n=1 Tax=Plectus sambesii TaxID=2011161 RepID=A0A914VBE1_9BILA